MTGNSNIVAELIKVYDLQSDLFDCKSCLLLILEGNKVPSEIAPKLGISERRLMSELNSLFFNIKQPKSSWKQFLYSLIDRKQCISCLSVLSSPQFRILNTGYLYSYCKLCESNQDRIKRNKNPSYNEEKRLIYKNNPGPAKANSAKRRALLKLAVPKWADLTKIKEIYNNCPVGHEVDHIIPLQGKFVCGLHVENNLQYLSVKDNRQKYNKFET